MKLPDQTEIDDVLNYCDRIEDEGINPYWGCTYIDGVKSAIEWLVNGGDIPIDLDR